MTGLNRFHCIIELYLGEFTVPQAACNRVRYLSGLMSFESATSLFYCRCHDCLPSTIAG